MCARDTKCRGKKWWAITAPDADAASAPSISAADSTAPPICATAAAAAAAATCATTAPDADAAFSAAIAACTQNSHKCCHRQLKIMQNSLVRP